MKRFRQLLLALPLAAAVSCGDGSALSPEVLQYATTILEQIQQAPTDVPHDGVRLVEIFGAEAGVPVTLAHRERVQVNHNGEFRLDVVKVLSSGELTTFDYEVLNSLRAGFHFRYRDPRVRDVTQLLDNYVITDAGTSVEVAGRVCARVSFEKVHSGTGGVMNLANRTYTVDTDVQTGLVLQVFEHAADGTLLSRVVYESLTLGSPAGMVPHVLANNEQLLPLGPELSSIVGGDVPQPTLLPDGYTLFETASVVDPLSRTWAKSTFTDGLEVLFVLSRPLEGSGPLSPKGSGKRRPSPDIQLGGTHTGALAEPPTEWLSFQIGSLGVLTGQMDGQDLIIVGRESLDELQLVVEQLK